MQSLYNDDLWGICNAHMPSMAMVQADLVHRVQVIHAVSVHQAFPSVFQEIEDLTRVVTDRTIPMETEVSRMKAVIDEYVEKERETTTQIQEVLANSSTMARVSQTT